MNLFYDSLVMVGVCFILKYASIISFVREPLKKIDFFEKLFKCALCLGFWVGLFYSFTSPYTLELAFYSAAICWISDFAIQFIMSKLD